MNGWIFSNELYDALPVARVRGSAAGLEELRVAAEGERFVWVGAPAPAAWRDRLSRSGTASSPGRSRRSGCTRRSSTAVSRGVSRAAGSSSSTTGTARALSIILSPDPPGRSPRTGAAAGEEILSNVPASRT